MEKIVILADNICDLSEELREFCGMDDYFRGHVHIGSDSEITATLDWSEISKEDMYELINKKKLDISTSPASPDQYYEKFAEYARQGYKIISMSLSSKISCTFSNAELGAQRVKEEIPDCEIYCYDTLKMSGAFGLLVLYAHLMKKEGKSFEEIIKWLEDNKFNVHQMGPIDDLMFLSRRGRISKGKAIMGSFAGVKPMGDLNDEGFCTVIAKVKGIPKSIEATAEYVNRMAVDVENQYIGIWHSDRERYAQKLKQVILSKMSPKDIFISEVFPGSIANVGPGMLGVYFLGERISTDLEKEKEVLEEILAEL